MPHFGEARNPHRVYSDKILFFGRPSKERQAAKQKTEASPSLGSPDGVLNRMLNASDNSISPFDEDVKW